MIRIMLAVKTKISNHLEVSFRDMNNHLLDPLKNRERFGNKFIRAMKGVCKSNGITGVINKSGLGKNRTTGITSDVVSNPGIEIFNWWCIHIKSGCVVGVKVVN